MMKHPFALFDTDCLEMNEARTGMSLRPRARVLEPKVGRLYQAATYHRIPLVFTTCCSGRMPRPEDFAGDLADVVFVPLSGEETSWRERIPTARRFYAAKATTGDPKQNAACRLFDMFEHNGNLAELVRVLNANTWVVYGNGFDLCVGSAVKGLLALHQNVVILTDVRVSSAGGTQESEESNLNAFVERGATLSCLEDILPKLAASHDPPCI